MAIRKTLPVAVLAIAMASCSDGPTVSDDVSPQPVTTVGQAPEPTPTDDLEDAVREYVSAIAGNDPDEMRDALVLAREDSAAHAYMQFQAVRAEALLDGGLPILSYPYDMTRTGGGYELCLDGDCTIFDGFASDQGLLTDLAVDGESPGPRLTMGDGDTVESNGVIAELLVAYQAITARTFAVILKLETGPRSASPFLHSAIYRSPAGAQRTATDAWGPSDLGAESHATVMVSFDGVDPGGQFTLDGCVDDCGGDFSVTVRVG